MTEPARALHLVPPPEGESTERAAPTDPRVGRVFDGRYVIEATLGSGGMGLVYRARHQILGKPFAVKVLKPDVSKDEQVMARFSREAQSASAIGSPHICDVSDFGTLPDGSTYFVMEFLDGPSLGSVMARAAGPLPTDRVVHIATQLCDALGAAHAREIVHRDLKPDNVHLVTRGGDPDFVKVLDFGIAKVATTDSKLTQAGQIFGTPHYMSPEQCSGREVDHRTDIYALGVMMYEMACGAVPFDADNLMGVLTKHVYEAPIPPRDLAPPVDVEPGLEAIILRCLAKAPGSRYGSMAELKADLLAVGARSAPRALLGALDARVPASSSPSLPLLPIQPSAQPAEPPRRRPLLTMLVVALLLALAGGASFGAAWTLAPGDASEPVVRVDPPADVDPPTPRPVPPTPTPPTPDVAPTAASTTLATDPAGAEVYGPDGGVLGNTPLVLERPAEGTVEYRVRMAGYEERTFVLSPETGSEVTLHLSSRRPVRPHTPRPPHVSTDPGHTTGGHPGGQTTTPATDHPVGSLYPELVDPFADNPRPPNALR